MKKIKGIIIFLFSSFILMTNENNFLNLNDVLNDYYKSFIYVSEFKRDFKIKEFIKTLKENKFYIKLSEIESIELMQKDKIEVKDTSWIIEKLNFIPGTILLSPSPKIPREYYKTKSNFNEKYLNYIIVVKTKPFSFKFYDESHHLLGKDASFEINFDIEYYLYSSNKILLEKIEDIHYNIEFLQDTSPLNTANRLIKVYGLISNNE